MAAPSEAIARARWGKQEWGSFRWGEIGPQTDREFFDLPASARWDGYGTWTPDDAAAADITTTAPTLTYVIECEGDEGALTLTIDGEYSTSGLTATSTAVEIAAALEAALTGLEVTATGGPLGTAAVTIELDDYTTDSNIALGVTTGEPLDFYEQVNTVAFYAAESQRYTIEVVRGSDGVLISEVPNLLGGTYEAAVDRAPTLSFEFPGTATAVISALTMHNRVVLRDRWGMALDVFVPARVKRVRNGAGVFCRVECDGILAKLANEIIGSIDGILPGGSWLSRAVHTQVWRLLYEQVGDNPITLGDIDTQIALTQTVLNVEDSNVLQEIGLLQERIPYAVQGHYYVDARGRFCWKLPAASSETLTIGERLRDNAYTVDYGGFANRVYAYGEGGDRRWRVNLTWDGADQEHEYIEDTASIALYGVRPVTLYDRRIRYGGTLLTKAQAFLSKYATPVIEYDLDALDLAQIQSDSGRTGGGWDSTWQDLAVGTQYSVVDSGNGVSADVTVVSISRDLANPLELRLQLANRHETMGGLFGDMSRRMYKPFRVAGPRDLYKGMARYWSPNTWDPEVSGDGDFAYGDGDFRRDDDGDLEWYDTVNGGWRKAGGLSDDTPLGPTELGEAGTGTLASRDTHRHPRQELDETDLETVAGTADEQIEAAISETAAAAVTSAEGTAGSTGEIADIGHTHQGQPWIQAATKGALPSADDGALGYATSTDRLYARADGAWLCITHLETS